jgi:UDPglucose 6-dehydrogenase
MNIGIIGTGYVGLVSGTCFAEMGNHVTCVDVDDAKVNKLRSGTLPIYEPDLKHLFDRTRTEGRLHFTTTLEDAVESSEILFFTLPTPPGEDGAADLSYVLQAAEDVAQILARENTPSYRIVANKSTVPVGTADRVQAVFAAHGLQNVDVVSNPEFLREGAAVDDFMKPDRVVIGTSSDKAGDLMTRLYEPFVRQGNPILVVDKRSAEMIKYAANSLLATRISFMNEVANLCDRVGADVEKVRLGISKDHRIGRHFLYPGIGFGGSCFPKDVQALARTGRAHDSPVRILESVLEVNDEQRHRLAMQVAGRFEGDLIDRTIAIWGLSFKPNTDDVREAPAHVIIQDLLDRGASIAAYDPEAIDATRARLGDEPRYGDDRYDVLAGADALVICTEWPEFRRPDLTTVKATLRRPILFDGRNLYDPGHMADLGFEYHSIGRPSYRPDRTDKVPDPTLLESTVPENGQS